MYQSAKLSQAKASEADELAQAIKLSELSAQKQQEENDLAKALKLAKAQLISRVSNKAIDDAEQAGHELSHAKLSTIFDESTHNVEHFLTQNLDLLGLDSDVLYEIYSAEQIIFILSNSKIKKLTACRYQLLYIMINK